MMSLLFGLTLFATSSPTPQNPRPHYLRLPPDWTVAYGGHVESGGSVRGPKGLIIYFPAYTPNGLVAYVQTALDMQTRLLRVVVDDRRIDIALTSKNLLAVSYSSSDYWTEVKDTRQAVTALLILLTHLDMGIVGNNTSVPAAGTPPVPPGTESYPYSRLATGHAFSFDKNSGCFFEREDYKRSKPWVVARTDLAMPEKSRWHFAVELLGGALRVDEAEDGAYWARYTDQAGRSRAFIGRKGEPANALLAILASLTYSPAKKRVL